MKILIYFLFSLSLFAEEFSWTPYLKKPSTKPYANGKAIIDKDLKKKILTSMDPSIMAMDDHREKSSLTILLFGDGGTGKIDQITVGTKMGEECKRLKCDFALGLGDMIYDKGFTKGEEFTSKDLSIAVSKFEKPYELLGNMNIWAIPGNHDWYGSVQKSIDYSKISPRWRMPYNHYEIPRLPNWIRIKGIDTTRIKRLGKASQLVMEQLPEEMEEFKGDTGIEEINSFCGFSGWKILFGHHGVYTSGFHGKINDGSLKSLLKSLNPRSKKGTIPELEDILNPIITRCKIPLYIVGHDHHQEMIKVIDPKTKKTLYHQVIQGSAGKIREVFNFKNDHFESLVKKPYFGFGILTINPQEADIKFYGYPEGMPKDFKMYYQYSIKLP